jgi:hypothetical protein
MQALQAQRLEIEFLSFGTSPENGPDIRSCFVQAREAQRLEIERQVQMKHALQETKSDRVRREREGKTTDAD